MKRICFCLLVLLVATPAAAQSDLISTIEFYRAQYPTPMTAAQKAEMLNRVAWHHRDEGWGLHLKTGGTRCPAPQGVETACDILVHGPTMGVYDVLVDHDNAASPAFRYVGIINSTSNFVPAIPPHAAHDLVVDFGANGTWVLLDGATYTQIHALSPELVATGDLDGNGKDEIILDFGSQYGIWVRMNNTSWMQLHTMSPTVISTGDLDGNGKDEVIIDFPGFGIYIWANNTYWQKLHSLSSSRIITGNLDGLGGDELIIDFPGQGIWMLLNGASWRQLHALNSNGMITGDFDGNGQADLIASFAGHGIWNFANASAWWPVHERDAVYMAAGDMNDNGFDELVIDFGPLGIWTRFDTGAWSQLHTVASEGITISDLDGLGRAEVVIDFGTTYGTWILLNGTSWVRAHPGSPDSIVVGDVN